MPSVHVPSRRCLGCGRSASKSELVRFTTVPDGDGWTLVRDDRSTLPGRGLYVCRRGACFGDALRRGAFARGARLARDSVRVDEALVDLIEAESR